MAENQRFFLILPEKDKNKSRFPLEETGFSKTKRSKAAYMLSLRKTRKCFSGDDALLGIFVKDMNAIGIYRQRGRFSDK